MSVMLFSDCIFARNPPQYTPMQTLTLNLNSGRSTKKPRRETLNGREYLVADATLLVEGVHDGSQGPLYYSDEEISQDPDAWNGMPLVVYHPLDEDEEEMSARTPSVIDKSGVGHWYSTTFKDAKLAGEAWFDEELVKKADAKLAKRKVKPLLPRLLKGEPVELSTGLRSENVELENAQEWNGEKFTHVATNIRPDHVAVLPDEKGACSVKDGCGINNKARPTTDIVELIPLRTMYELIVANGCGGNCSCNDCKSNSEIQLVPNSEVELFNCGGEGGVPGPCPKGVSKEEAQKTGLLKKLSGKVDALANKIPGVKQVKNGVKKLMGGIHKKLESRYGTKAATVIMTSGSLGGYGVMATFMATTGTPGIPVVNDLISIAVHTAVAEVGYQLGLVGKGKSKAAPVASAEQDELSDEEMKSAVQEMFSELQAGLLEQTEKWNSEITAQIKNNPSSRSDVKAILREGKPLMSTNDCGKKSKMKTNKGEIVLCT